MKFITSLIKNPTKNSNPILNGSLAAIIVFLSGFFTMNILWHLIGTINSLRSFYDYNAATWGDGLCLPILIFCLVTIIKKNNTVSFNNVIIGATTSLSIVIAILIQASWLWSDNTLLNWSIPQPHLFNIAGWYHSLFFIFVFGIIGNILPKIIKLISIQKNNFFSQNKELVFGISFSSFLFLFLHMSDDHVGIKTIYLFTIIIAIISLLWSVLSAIVSITLKIKELSYDKMPQIPIYMGLLCSYGIAILIVEKPFAGNVLISLGGAICASLIWDEKKGLKQFIIPLIITSACTYPVYEFATSKGSVWEVALACFIVATLCSKIECLLFEQYKGHTLTLIVLPFFILWLRYPSVLSWVQDSLFIFTDNISEWVDVIAFIIIYVLFRIEILKVAEHIIEFEKLKNNNQISEKEFSEKKKLSYLRISIIVLGIVFLLLQDVNAPSRISNILSNSLSHVEIIGFIFFLGMLSLFLIISKSIFHTRKTIFVVCLICYLSIIGFSIIYLFNHSLPSFEPSVFTLIQLALIFFALIGTPTMIAHSFQINTINLRGLKGKENVKSFCGLIFLGCLFISIINGVMLIVNLSAMTLALTFFNLLFAFLLLPSFCCMCLKLNPITNHVVPNKPIDGILLDGFSGIIAHIFLVSFPCMYISCEAENFIVNLLHLLKILIPAMMVAGTFMKNNSEHIIRQKELINSYPEEVDLWWELYTSIKTQSIITAFLTLPYWLASLVILYFPYLKGTRDEKKNQGYYMYVISRYIDPKYKIENFNDLFNNKS